MGTLMQNTAEGGSNGTALTASNSGGGSGDPFSAVVGSGVVTFSNSNPYEGSLCYKMDATNGASRTAIWPLAASNDKVSIRCYVRIDSSITANGFSFLQLRSATSNLGGVSFKSTNEPYLSDTTHQVAGGNGSYGQEVGVWYRWNIIVDRAAGTFTFEYFRIDPDTGVEEETATYTSSGSGANFGTDPFVETRWFKTNTTATGIISVDAIAQEDGRTTDIGPYELTIPLGVNVGSDVNIFSDEFATLTATVTGGAGSPTYAWSKVSGPTGGTFSNSSIANPTFKPDAAGAYVLRCTVNDGTESDTDDITVTVTARTLSDSSTFTTLEETTNWTRTGGTSNLNALTDGSNTSYLTSQEDPVSQVLRGAVGLTKPDPGQDLTVTVGLRRNNGTSGSAVVKLLEGTTVRSTKTIPSIDTAFTNYNPVFPAADIAAIADDSWGFDVKVQVEVTAS